MTTSHIDPEVKSLFDNYVESLQFGSSDEIHLARRAWFMRFPTDRGNGSGGGAQEKSQIDVIRTGKLFSDIASGSGQLTLATVLATEGGMRSATEGEIKDALYFWSGSTDLMLPNAKYNHLDWMSTERRNWAQRDGIHGWRLTINGKNGISSEALRVVEAYRQSRVVAQRGSVADDIAEICSQEISETVREQLINARIGQGKFRKDLLQCWNGRCAVTGIAVVETIRASHIKPWRDSTNEERLDPHNGLPLLATLDALFDGGLITFDSDGKMLVSSILTDEEREKLSLDGLRLTNKPHQKTCEYLSYHSQERFWQ